MVDKNIFKISQLFETRNITIENSFQIISFQKTILNMISDLAYIVDFRYIKHTSYMKNLLQSNHLPKHLKISIHYIKVIISIIYDSLIIKHIRDMLFG